MSRLGSWLAKVLWPPTPAAPAVRPLFVAAPPFPTEWPMPALAAPNPVPAEVAELLAGTVGPDGLPGVLADWLDERSADWSPLAAALRAADPGDEAEPGQWVGAPRHLVLAGDVVAWLVELRVPADFNQPGHSWLRLGFHRTTPGREAAYRLAIRSQCDAAQRAELRRLFGMADG